MVSFLTGAGKPQKGRLWIKQKQDKTVKPSAYYGEKHSRKNQEDI